MRSLIELINLYADAHDGAAIANITTRYRRHSFWMPRNSYCDMFATGDFADGGIKTLPPSPRYIDFSPGVCCCTANFRGGSVQVTANEAACDSQLSARFHEKSRVVTTGAALSRASSRFAPQVRSNKKPTRGGLFIGYGALGRIRTSDRSVRSRVLYPAELQAHFRRRRTIRKGGR